MHGEHRVHIEIIPMPGGSSPYARGALGSMGASWLSDGIIPVCTGSTSGRALPGGGARDHPRMHGEHHLLRQVFGVGVGSSPYARGAQRGADRHTQCPGIIPVCTGSTIRLPRRGLPEWDHPRMHGEHHPGANGEAGGDGSSPYARGARAIHRVGATGVGIIPVCTGSTPGNKSKMPQAWDHPRMHGEHGHEQLRAGSRPGIIPVCTGSTIAICQTSARSTDHPRMHGEHLATVAALDKLLGSSPYARGAHGRLLGERRRMGIIPVCTGSTNAPRTPTYGGRGSSPYARGAQI